MMNRVGCEAILSLGVHILARLLVPVLTWEIIDVVGGAGLAPCVSGERTEPSVCL